MSSLTEHEEKELRDQFHIWPTADQVGFKIVLENDDSGSYDSNDVSRLIFLLNKLITEPTEEYKTFRPIHPNGHECIYCGEMGWNHELMTRRCKKQIKP